MPHKQSSHFGSFTARPNATVAVTFAISVMLLTLSLMANQLQAQEDPPPPPHEPYRECSSRGTVFEDEPNLDKATEIFSEMLQKVSDERQKILEDPSHWKCDSTEDPEMPLLKEMAESMPGWKYRRATLSFVGERYTTELRPVTFNAFSSIVGEFLREYECKVAELQGNTIAVVANNDDYPPDTKFCCTENGCEPESEAATRCTGPVTDSPKCEDVCPVPDYISTPDASSRFPAFFGRAIPQRTRARVAVDRALRMMRSYELEHETIRHLMCVQRASLDLLSQTALLAEATSCMPKIWDVATSLHDRKE